jgi:hypothetical protein
MAESRCRRRLAVRTDAVSEHRRLDHPRVAESAARAGAASADGCADILIVLLDDAEAALPWTFGGEVRTATLDRVRA